MLPAAIKRVSTQLSVEDQVCGYLRHISSGTCVGVSVGTQLTTGEDYCNSGVAGTLFCYSPRDTIITRMGNNDNTCYGNCLELRRNSAEDVECQWRLKMNGRVRRAQILESESKMKCWKRDNTDDIMLETCDQNESEEEAKPQQFAFQIQDKTPGILFYHALRKIPLLDKQWLTSNHAAKLRVLGESTVQ